MEKAELVLKSDPKNEAALILKGAVLTKKKDFDGARRFFESVVGREVRKPDGYMLLTSLYAQTGDMKNAEKTLLEGIRFNEKYVPLYIVLVDLYLKNKQTDDAVGVMQKLVVMQPDAAEHRLALAGIYWAEGKEQQAVEVLKAFLSAGPDKEQRWVQVAGFIVQKTDLLKLNSS